MVVRLATSDPPDGSVIASATMRSPEIIPGRISAFTSADAPFWMGGAPM